MSIDFYYMPESPPCRLVEMVASMAGVKLNLHYINLPKGEHLSEEYAKMNPSKKIPFIIDGDVKIGESRAIAAYICNKYLPDNNTLYPRDPQKRAKVDELLWFEGTSLFQSVSLYVRPLIFGSGQLNQEDEVLLRKNLKLLDERLIASKGSKYPLGDITIADLAIVAGMSVVEACELDITEFKAVIEYLQQLKTDIPRYHEINDTAIENMKNFFKSKRK